MIVSGNKEMMMIIYDLIDVFLWGTFVTLGGALFFVLWKAIMGELD